MTDRDLALSPRDIHKRLVTLIAMAAMIVGIVAEGISTASASSSRTYVYACGMGARWGCPVIRPGEIAFGALYDVNRLSWSSWGSTAAHGRGHYHGFGSYRAYVALYGVRTHNGRRYFSWIKIAEPGHKTRYLQYSGGLWHTR